jgi:hypothetical protein
MSARESAIQAACNAAAACRHAVTALLPATVTPGHSSAEAQGAISPNIRVRWLFWPRRCPRTDQPDLYATFKTSGGPTAAARPHLPPRETVRFCSYRPDICPGSLDCQRRLPEAPTVDPVSCQPRRLRLLPPLAVQLLAVGALVRPAILPSQTRRTGDNTCDDRCWLPIVAG